MLCFQSGWLIVLLSITSTTLSWEPTNSHSPDCELVLAQVLYRHGDRNPVVPYPTDPYKNESYYWPEGFGQLSKIGKMQQFELGQYLRKRYNGFLSEIYSPYEIYVQSSHVDRTIMSALSNLAGLYPPKDNQSQWNPDLEWQPIPVHNMPGSIDETLSQDAPCPRYNEIFLEFATNSEVIQKLMTENKELFGLLANYSGLNMTSIREVEFLWDTLEVQKFHDMAWPFWATELYAKYGPTIDALIGFSFKVTTYTMEMKRLKGGPILKELTDNMLEKRNNTMDKRQKFFMYSAHDTTIASLLNTLDMFNDMMPPYRSMVIVELHRNITSNAYFVEIMYRNSTEHEPYKLQLPGCDFSCDLNLFMDLVSSKIPTNWEKECKALNGEGHDVVGVVVTIMLLFILVGLCIAIGLILKAYFRNKRGSEPKPPKYPYLHLQTEGDGDEEDA